MVEGETDRGERREIWRGFRSGVIQVVTNVYVATEGFDLPAIEVVILARGCGHALLRLALERLHASGVREAFLAAAPDRRRIGNADLQRFYRQHGFQHWVSDPSIMMARLPWKPTPEPDDE
jgi:GNAT superfamily N-acetyltransferase